MKRPWYENRIEGPDEEEYAEEPWDDGYFIDEDENFETGQDGWQPDGTDIKAEYFPDETWTEEDWQRFFTVDETEEEEPLSRIPRWISNVLVGLVLLGFVMLCIPMFSNLGGQWDFLSENLALRQEPMVQQSLPAILSIVASQEDNAVPERSGTGFFISADGWLLSNAHVVGEAERLRVETENGAVYFTDHYVQLGDYDIAAIKVKAQDCSFIPIDIDVPPAVGDQLTIVGNPLGFMRVATRGPVLNRYDWFHDDGWVFEMDARIRSGSSGSPVLNSDGQAVGIIYATRLTLVDGETADTALALPLALVAQQLRDLGILE